MTLRGEVGSGGAGKPGSRAAGTAGRATAGADSGGGGWAGTRAVRFAGLPGVGLLGACSFAGSVAFRAGLRAAFFGAFSGADRSGPGGTAWLAFAGRVGCARWRGAGGSALGGSGRSGLG
jgi:hypothetical protein